MLYVFRFNNMLIQYLALVILTVVPHLTGSRREAGIWIDNGNGQTVKVTMISYKSNCTSIFLFGRGSDNVDTRIKFQYV